MFYDIVLKLQRFKKLKIILISNFNKGDGMWVSYYLKFLNRKSISSVQFSSVAQSCPTLCDPMDRSTPGLPVHYQLQELAQTHIHWVSDAIQPSHPLSSPSPPAFNLSQHQSFPNSQFFAWGGQSIGVSASPWTVWKEVYECGLLIYGRVQE